MPEADTPAARLPRYIQIFTPDEQPYEQTPVIASEAKQSHKYTRDGFARLRRTRNDSNDSFARFIEVSFCISHSEIL
jgi:hypothetical protein